MSLELYNWLRVYRSAEAARLGPDGSQQLQTKVGRSEKCVALRDGCGTSIGVIAACFARVLRGYSGRACMGFLLILQEVRRVCETRNQFNDIQALMRYMVFDDWHHLMDFMIRGLELESHFDTS